MKEGKSIMYFDEKLKQLRQQADRKRRLEGELADLRAQRQDLAGKVTELEKQKNAEQADVDRLEGRSLAAFFYNVVGKMAEKLTQERREAYAAAVKYDAAARELGAVEEDIQRREAELLGLEGCERKYEETLKAKADAVKAAGTPEAREIFRLEERIARLESRKKETGEAAVAGAEAYRIADSVLSALGGAEGWGQWDILGGGFISDVAKYSHLDHAQSQIEQLQVALRRFKTELADVTVQADIQVNVDSFLRFADYFFDNIFTDWAVLERIGRAKAQVQSTRDQIDGVICRLDDLMAAAERERAEAKKMLDELVLRASVD